jgi:nucleoid-associated protein YgaU
MSRYKNTKIITDKITKYPVLSSTEYPIIKRKDSDIVYFVKFDDSYHTLAYRFYGDTSLWWIIARANNNFAGNFTMVIGSKIIIPTEIGEILSKLAKLNR